MCLYFSHGNLWMKVVLYKKWLKQRMVLGIFCFEMMHNRNYTNPFEPIVIDDEDDVEDLGHDKEKDLPTEELESWKQNQRNCLQNIIDRNHSAIQRFKDGLAGFGFLHALQQHSSVLSSVLCFSAKALTASDLETMFRPDLSPAGSNRRQKEAKTLGFWADYLHDSEEVFAFILVFLQNTAEAESQQALMFVASIEVSGVS
ncbi:hypothetical protein CRENBAI_026417 [Crenichthys baileyi]|uniref:Uncharacterized protein n=1 Tax=Crenichthys baileyi TaxID=28760 RepID=A0AAV9REL4_9TELE